MWQILFWAVFPGIVIALVFGSRGPTEGGAGG